MTGSDPSLGASRRQARERALDLLYEADLKGRSVPAVLAELPVAPDPYTVTLVEGVEAHRDELDELITANARGWTVERMPVIDLALLRIGLFELGHRPDVPTGVVLAEAVDLASRFSTDDSGRFVNGLLARLAEDLRGPPPDGEPASAS